MASITSLMNSSGTSSIYGNRNVLSGLASGMDTETMIENAVSGIKKKIQSLYQKRTKIEWQQEAYRSIIDKAVNLGNRYTSYSSKTNLLSSSFFNNAVITAVNGTYANKVTATGKSSSDIKINAVKQLASAASYSVDGSAAFGGDVSTISGNKDVDLFAGMDVSCISGGLSFQYGGSNGTVFDLSFDESDTYYTASDLADAIREKLGEQTWSYTKNGIQETVKGSDVIDVQVDFNGDIKFSDKTGNGNAVYITYASGDLKSALDVSTGSGHDTLSVGGRNLSKTVNTREYLSDKELIVSLNGVSKKINLADVLGGDENNTDFVNALQKELDKAFGANKVKVSRDEESGKMSFNAVEKGSTLTLAGSAIKALGFESGDSNYINTGKKLSDLLDKEMLDNNRLLGTFDTDDHTPTEKTTSNGVTYYVDDAGNRVDKDGYRITETGESIYQFEINGAQINVTNDTTLEDLMTSINANANAGVKVSYSTLTNEFKFTATETGANSKIEFGGLADALFNPPSGVSGGDSFSSVYGLNTEEGSVNYNIPYEFVKDGNFWETYSVKATSDMTEDEIVSAVQQQLADGYTASFKDGQLVITGSDDQEVAIKASKTVSFEIDGGYTEIEVTGDMTMDDIVEQLNRTIGPMGNCTASIDAQSGQIVLTGTDGDPVDLKITNLNEEDEAKQTLSARSNSSYTAGTDAVMDVEINGVRFENLIRSNNSFDLDGLTVSVKDTFGVDENGNLLTEDKDGNAIEAITFKSTTDTDTIMNAIRSFVNDYNEMVSELKGAFSTQPAYKNGTTRYEPLTAEEEEGYTESQLAAYNEKAKQGILFGDTTLSSFYSKLLNAIAPGGADGQTLREIGIGTSYENGLTTLSLNEDKLRTALESDPDKVKNAFTKTREGGSSGDGLMQNLQNTLNSYVKTTGEPKGVLIVRAGSVKSPTSLNNNSLNTQINNIDTQITRWQDKMSSQIDRYTKQFTKLEQLVSAMNAQYSALSGLMGGTDSYY